MKEGKHFFEFGPFRLDPGQRLLLRDGQPVPVQPRTFEVLQALVENSDKLILKEELMKMVWQDSFVEESNLTQNIFVLRKILGAGDSQKFIATIPGRGYRFVAAVKIVRDTPGLEWSKTESPAGSRGAETSRPGKAVSFPSRRQLLAVSATVITACLVAFAALTYPPVPAPRVLRVKQITHSGRVAPYTRVVTDGNHLYFTQSSGGIFNLAQVSVDGGEPTAVATTIPSLEVFDIDVARSRLLVQSQSADFNNPFWVLSTAGGAGERVGDLLAMSTRWSSDGRSILFGYNNEIYQLNEDSKEKRRMVVVPGNVLSVRLSPDGTRLIVTAQDMATGGTSLWESTADGGNLHPLTFGWKSQAPIWGEGESFADWTPDGKYLVFRAARNGVESFWVIREKTGWLRSGSSAPIQLYASPDHIGEPRFSPDGKKVFFVDYHERRELVRYDNAQKQFVPYLDGMPARLVSFSSDGKWLSYRNEVDGSLWRSHADGSNKLQLTSAPLVAYHSCWSAGGKTIIFGGFTPGHGSQLYTVPKDGGAPQALAPSNASDSEPSCSPDGRFVLFERRTGLREDQQTAIYSLDLNSLKSQVIPGSVGFEGVHCSPDGKYIAAADQLNHKLMLWDFARQSWSELSDGSPYGWGIRWSSDSRYVYYQHPDEGQDQPLYRVRIRDRKVELITSAQGILRADVLGYTMTGLTPNNEALATLLHRNSDIYALELDLP